MCISVIGGLMTDAVLTTSQLEEGREKQFTISLTVAENQSLVTFFRFKFFIKTHTFMKCNSL